MFPRHCEHDRQTQAASSFGAAAGVVRTTEAVERVRKELVAETGAFVENFDDDPGFVTPRPHAHAGSRGRKAQRLLEDVVVADARTTVFVSTTKEEQLLRRRSTGHRCHWLRRRRHSPRREGPARGVWPFGTRLRRRELAWNKGRNAYM
jgi:hypothetical protein